MAIPKALTAKKIEKKLTTLSGWKSNPKGTQLVKTFQFNNYVSGLTFLAKIAVVAEVYGHHPELTLSYSKVKVVLTTEEVKALTTKDFDIAKRIDAIRIS